MAQQELYIGSMGPFFYEDTDTYPGTATVIEGPFRLLSGGAAVTDKVFKSDANGVFSPVDPSTDLFPTGLTVGSGSGNVLIEINGGTNNSKGFQMESAGTRSWKVEIADNRSGSDAGDNFKLTAYDDAGTLIDAPLTITRASGGEALFTRNVHSNATLKANANVEAGVAATTRGILMARHGSSSNKPGVLQLYDLNGVAWYFFVTIAGVFRVHTALPTADTDGSAV